jgi:general secretion pathway protein F
MFIHMVDVGEHSGHLDQALHRLADHLEAQARFRSRMLNALAYPVLMAVVGLGVLAFLFSYVLPKITDIVADLDQVLPWPTRLLLALGDAVDRYGWLGLVLLVAALILAGRYLQTPAGRLWRDRTLLRLPILGPFVLGQSTAYLSRTLGVLLQSGVSLLQALDIGRKLTANRVLQQALEQATACVREGESLAEPLRRSRVFPDMLVQMTAAGERSGALDDMLLRVAESFEHQTDMALSRMLALLEPLMILLMGTIVGFVVIAILLPIFQASQGLG